MSNKKILYIEDNELNRRLIRQILEQEQYTVVEAGDGLRGVEVALDERPDLILMNINLPGLNGYEATTKLKSLPHLANTPIVALTANAMPGDRERSLVSGCDGYIPKSIEYTSFVSQVKAFLAGKRETIDESHASYYLREYRDRLINRLYTKIEDLTRLNAELEQRVDARTGELREAQAQLVAMEKKRAVIELAGAVAHELRQPQTVITGLIGLILAEGYNQTHLERDLNTIVEHIKVMSRLIDSMRQLHSYKTKSYRGDIRIVDLEESSHQPPAKEEDPPADEDK